MGQFLKKTIVVCFSLSILLITVVCTAEDAPSWRLSVIRFIESSKKPVNLLPLSIEAKQAVKEDSKVKEGKANTDNGSDNNVSSGMIQQPRTVSVVTINPTNSIPEIKIPNNEKEVNLVESHSDVITPRQNNQQISGVEASNIIPKTESNVLPSQSGSVIKAGDIDKEGLDESLKKEAGKVIIRIYFRFNSAHIFNGSKKQILDVVDRLRKGLVSVKGYASKTGNVNHNLWLSQKRAEAVRDFLKENGVTVKEAVGLGIIPDNNHKINKKVEIIREPLPKKGGINIVE